MLFRSLLANIVASQLSIGSSLQFRDVDGGRAHPVQLEAVHGAVGLTAVDEANNDMVVVGVVVLELQAKGGNTYYLWYFWYSKISRLSKKTSNKSSSLAFLAIGIACSWLETGSYRKIAGFF